MRIHLSDTQWNLVGLLGDGLIRSVFDTSRIEVAGEGPARRLLDSGRAIAVAWHSRILALAHLNRGLGGVIMVSAHTDGEIIARILQRQGHCTVRGSSTRGGARALAQLVHQVREKRPVCIIPDGPQGPRFRFQHGAIALARKTGVPIIPFTYSARDAAIFSSWDRFLLPRPFTRCLAVYGEPIHVPADPALHEWYRQRVEDELNRITRMADRRMGRPERDSEPAPFSPFPSGPA